MKHSKRSIGIIPARYASSRLPGKPLIKICGKELIRHVWENSIESKLLSRVIIATDDPVIKNTVNGFGAECVMTDCDLPSGTDRIAEAYLKAGEDADVIVNIQGDEPLLKASSIDKLLERFLNSHHDVGTLVTRITHQEELSDPGTVKVAISGDKTALYFSRSPIPFSRDNQLGSWRRFHDYYKHIGIYAYRKESLFRFQELKPSNLEDIEKLEQLRLMEDGAKYLCVETDELLLGVDTEADLTKVESLLRDQIK